MNAKLRSASGEIGLLVDGEVQGTDPGFRAGDVTRRTAYQIDKDRDRMRTHLSDALGYLVWQECRPLPEIGEQPGATVLMDTRW